MHGVKRRVRTSAEKEAAQRADELAFCARFRAAQDAVFALRRRWRRSRAAGEGEGEGEGEAAAAAAAAAAPAGAAEKEGEQPTGAEVLAATRTVLEMNPDVYTMWSFRRETLLALLGRGETSQGAEEEEEEEKEEEDGKAGAEPAEGNAPPSSLAARLVADELALTQGALRKNPKSYWVWFHRRWVLSRVAAAHGCADWARELVLCVRLLAADGRNFHCWNHRRFAAAHARERPEDTHAFVRAHIDANFSNYSAWHHRSVGVRALHAHAPAALADALRADLELVRNAFYTEPDDQSAWFYQRWLLLELVRLLRRKRDGGGDGDGGGGAGALLAAELAHVEELVALEPSARWPRFVCATLLAALGRRAEAAEMLARLAELDPVRAGHYRDRRTALLRQQRDRGAAGLGWGGV